VTNPDCALELASTTASYAAFGAPHVLSMDGGLSAGVDAGFLAKECLDRSPGRSRTGGRHHSADDAVDDGAMHAPKLCSFAGPTGVLLADGSVKAIATIEVGDWVLAAEPETGERGPRQVTAQWVHADQLVDLEVDGGVVTTTEDHPFWNATDQQWQRADALDVGEMVLTAMGI
jgi:hypothetical protein